MQTDTVVTSDTVAQLPSGPLPIRYTGRALKDENGDDHRSARVRARHQQGDGDHRRARRPGGGGGRGQARHARRRRASSRATTRRSSRASTRPSTRSSQPITEAAAVLAQVAQRELDVRVTGDYKGDHATLKDNLNLAIENLDVVADAGRRGDRAGHVGEQPDQRGQPEPRAGRQRAVELARGGLLEPRGDVRDDEAERGQRTRGQGSLAGRHAPRPSRATT